jgi:hypothetical protein
MVGNDIHVHPLTCVQTAESLERDRAYCAALWTNDNRITADKMVFMYAINSLIHGWWEKVTLIIWGAPAKLVSEDVNIQKRLLKHWMRVFT